MKVLIVGDFSSFGKELRNGFIKYMIDTDVISSGDYWKNIKSGSYDLEYRYDNFFYKVYSGLKNRIFLNSFVNSHKNYYDYILLMSLEFLDLKNYNLKKKLKLSYSLKSLEKMLKNKRNIYLIAAGNDYFLFKNLKKFLENKSYFITEDMSIEKKYFLTLKERKKIIEGIKGVIPVTYEYAEAYRNSELEGAGKVKNTIPLPITTRKIKLENILDGKIVIFHGINREDVKGTKWIKIAMENIQKKYPDKVEIIIDGKMPLEEYKKVIAKTNILIDQCRSYGYGMNALYGMAMGKLVFSGNEPENEKEFGEKNIPIVNIIPDVDDIEKKLEYYILNPELIISEGRRARKFVERFHDSEVIAKQYLKLFEEDLNK